jgi:Tol biopolymer transport system component
MTRDRSVDERISAWLQDEAPDQLPDRVLQATFERTRPTRQRRTIFGWRPSPMSRLTTGLIAVGAAAIAIVVIGVALRPAQPSVGGPSPSPTLAPSGTAAESLPPITLTGQIVFQRTVDGNADLYMMNLDRSGLVRLTDDPEIDSDPSWSPDGRQIAFTRGANEGRDVFVMNADGSGEVQLTETAEGEESPSFSPDGSEIAFLRYVDPTYFDFFLISVDGSNERRVYHQDGPYAAHPIWATDGRALYFNIDTSPATHLDIARLEFATGGVTRIADDSLDDSTFALSRDGSTIAFQSDRDPGGIFLMDTDGMNVRHVIGGWDKGYPLAWAPDGNHLVYNVTGGIYVVSIDTGDAVKWTDGGLGVAWRPQP